MFPLFYGILIDLQIAEWYPPAQHPTAQALYVPPSAEGGISSWWAGQVLSSQARLIGFEMAIFLKAFHIDFEKSVYTPSVWNHSYKDMVFELPELSFHLYRKSHRKREREMDNWPYMSSKSLDPAEPGFLNPIILDSPVPRTDGTLSCKLDEIGLLSLIT